MTAKDDKYWIALGMIQPEWIYMNHFLDDEEIHEEINEEITKLIKPVARAAKVNFHPRVDR